VDGGRTVVIRKASSSEVWQCAPAQRICIFGPCDRVVAFGTMVVVAVRCVLEVFDIRSLGWAALEKEPMLRVALVTPQRKNHSAVAGSFGKSSKKKGEQVPSEGATGSCVEQPQEFGGFFFCIFEGCVFSLPLNFPGLTALASSTKELHTHTSQHWCTSGTVSCLSFLGGHGFSGHTSGVVSSWVLVSGEIVKLYNLHSCRIAAILATQDKLFSVGMLDGLVKQTRLSAEQEFRTWRTEMVSFCEIRVVGTFVVLSSRLSLWFVDMLSSDAAVPVVLLCNRRIIDWKCETVARRLWTHIVTNDGVISSFLMSGSSLSSPYMPDLRLIPDLVVQLAYHFRSGSFLVGPKLSVLAMTVDGRTVRLDLSKVYSPPDFSSWPEAIVRVQARVRQRLVVKALSKNKLSLDQARQMRTALRQAAMLEFSQTDRLELMAAQRAMVFECFPAAGRSICMACISIAEAHLDLGKALVKVKFSFFSLSLSLFFRQKYESR
jgi:hypothetical protein